MRHRPVRLAALLIVLSTFAAASTTVTLLSPAAGSTVSSPVNFQASATSTNGVSGWAIYVDNNTAYTNNSGSSTLNTSVSLATGKHSVLIRAWDNISGYGSTPAFTITVGTQTSGTSGTTVTVQSPTAGSTVSSPVTFQASATSPNGVSGWAIYVDNNTAYKNNSGSSTLNTSVSLSTGSHTVLIRAWDNVSGYGSSPSFTISVGSGSTTTTSTTVTVQSPSTGSTDSSPVTFSATGSSPNGISGWAIYDNNNTVYKADTSSNTLSTSVSLAAGAHTLLVRAWDKVSGYGTSPPIYINVGSTSSSGTIQHVAIVVMENKSYAQVIGSSSMPYLNSLASQYGLAANYYANGTQSLPDYFMLTVGDTIATDASYTGTVTEDNVVRELVKAGKSWKAYAESIPYQGYLGTDVYPYMKIHNAFAYMSDVINSTAQANNIVPFSQLAKDMSAGALPSYMFIIPNNQSNTHDCPPGMSSCTLSETLQYGDNWLKNNIGPLLSNPQFQNSGILVITFDESADGNTTGGGGHVATIIIGPTVQRNFMSSTFYQHQSALRMMMQTIGMTTYPNAAATAPNMREFFTQPLP
ncbi:MAG: alkaline phosphatase family protein [Terriglobales bacterium]